MKREREAEIRNTTNRRVYLAISESSNKVLLTDFPEVAGVNSSELLPELLQLLEKEKKY